MINRHADSNSACRKLNHVAASCLSTDPGVKNLTSRLDPRVIQVASLYHYTKKSTANPNFHIPHVLDDSPETRVHKI